MSIINPNIINTSNMTRVNLNWANKYWFNKSTPKFVNKKNVSANTGRRSRPEVFCRKGVLRNFAKFTEKYLRQSLFFNNVAGLCQSRTAVSYNSYIVFLCVSLLKMRPWHRGFPANFAKFLRTSFFTEHLWCLLLYRI